MQSPNQDLSNPAKPAKSAKNFKPLMWIFWPSFLSACLLEMLVFAFVDPHDLPFTMIEGASSSSTGLAPMGVYTLAFFAFWAISATASALSLYLAFTEDAPSPIPKVPQ